MPTLEGYQFRSDFAKKYQALGEALGEARGEASGEARGTLVSLRNAILGVVDTRALRVNSTARRRIERETDLKTLRRWLTRAVIVDMAAAIFDQ